MEQKTTKRIRDHVRPRASVSGSAVQKERKRDRNSLTVIVGVPLATRQLCRLPLRCVFCVCVCDPFLNDSFAGIWSMVLNACILGLIILPALKGGLWFLLFACNSLFFIVQILTKCFAFCNILPCVLFLIASIRLFDSNAISLIADVHFTECCCCFSHTGTVALDELRNQELPKRVRAVYVRLGHRLLGTLPLSYRSSFAHVSFQSAILGKQWGERSFLSFRCVLDSLLSDRFLSLSQHFKLQFSKLMKVNENHCLFFTTSSPGIM